MILTAQFFDFFACFLREEFFVIKFRRTSYSNEEMQPLGSIYYMNTVRNDRQNSFVKKVKYVILRVSFKEKLFK